ncbi:MAG: DUF3106 domain-containing protein [Nitrosospira sp.]|nr:DUF3106 domain-containing protein [Nitrosospira sp.]
MVRSFLAIALCLCLLFSPPALAEAAQPSWDELTTQQREVLAPLAEAWNSMDPAKKKKWLGIVKRYPGMTPSEQRRTQTQMREWYSLTLEQRDFVREKYKMINKLPPEKRQEIKRKWRDHKRDFEGRTPE